MHRLAVALLLAVAPLLLVACRKPRSGGATGHDGGLAKPTLADTAVVDNRPWLSRWAPAAIAPRFAELRDAASLGCVLDYNEDYQAVREIARNAPVLVTRMAAFARVERARPDGESPTLEALTAAVSLLADVDDIEGLRLAFAEADRFTLPLHLYRGDEAYRARVGRPVAVGARNRDRLAVIRETALGGDVAAAAAIYDHELTAIEIDSPYRRPTQVGALVALGRIDAARAVIAQAPAEERMELALAWLHTAIRVRDGLDLAVAAVVAEDQPRASDDSLPDTLWDALRAARRTGQVAALGPLRAWLVTHVNQYDAIELFEDAVLRGDHAMRGRLEPTLSPSAREEVLALHAGTLAEALTWADAQRHDPETFAQVWVRHLVEGADPAIEAKLAAAICGPELDQPAVPPLPPKPGMHLTVTAAHPRDLRACKGSHLTLKLAGADPADTWDEDLDGSCRGRDFDGARPGRVDHVAGRDVALLIARTTGDEDESARAGFKIAVERCDQIFVSQQFGSRELALGELAVEIPPDSSELQVVASSLAWRGVVYKLRLPSSCNEFPHEEVLADDY